MKIDPFEALEKTSRKLKDQQSVNRKLSERSKALMAENEDLLAENEYLYQQMEDLFRDTSTEDSIALEVIDRRIKRIRMATRECISQRERIKLDTLEEIRAAIAEEIQKREAAAIEQISRAEIRF